ncbi:MAG: ATP phosphoribosyltransferase [Leptospirales bacterium]|nr:ATP phosphoribosyltransferase [Leptospirales bacterium]
MADESIEFFERAGFARFSKPRQDRSLAFLDDSGKIRAVLVRSQDVPTYVLQGGAHAGITGRDVLEEGAYDLTAPLELGFGQCRLALAAPAERAAELLQSSHLRVATKYPRLAMDYFFKRGVSCEVIKLHGSIELAPTLGLSDCIVDLVSTGATLKANGLREIETILQSQATLTIRRAAYALDAAFIQDLLSSFRSALAATQ